jgi:hypothetical protein
MVGGITKSNILYGINLDLDRMFGVIFCSQEQTTRVDGKFDSKRSLKGSASRRGNTPGSLKFASINNFIDGAYLIKEINMTWGSVI